MATFDTSSHYVALHNGTSVFSTAFSAVRRWNDARVTRKALSKLTSRELEDIGLTFADVDRIGLIAR